MIDKIISTILHHLRFLGINPSNNNVKKKGHCEENKPTNVKPK